MSEIPSFDDVVRRLDVEAAGRSPGRETFLVALYAIRALRAERDRLAERLRASAEANRASSELIEEMARMIAARPSEPAREGPL